jgi:hypothetical protein
MYKAAKHMTGKEVIGLFKRYGIADYVLSCYEALHTTGTNSAPVDKILREALQYTREYDTFDYGAHSYVYRQRGGFAGA